MEFTPIAIIGQGCVLPGALSPQQLWDVVVHGRDILSTPPPEYWGLTPEEIATDPGAPKLDHTWSDRGGYVRGFADVFGAEGYAVDPERLVDLDPLFLWTLYAARQALEDSGHGVDASPTSARTGVILGNLSYPTKSLAGLAQQVWFHRAGLGEAPSIDPRNRFMSGYPSHLIAEALGLGGHSMSLDAACASSLYAMKLACDRLQDRSADLMLAGGVNHADDLFLHVGFCALNAMSRSGQSRPFHRDADGLVPAEGAGFVVLKRLDDAWSAGDKIHGVIRGIGLSNDGRGRGMLTPSEQGQVRAMQRAYAMSGLSPEDINLVECHATGTPLGDSTELRSMAKIFEGRSGVPIGSLKSNLGHLITASGVAGLLKVLAAFEHEQRPPTIHVDAPVGTLDETPFRLLAQPERWGDERVRRAAINNFGFGGNNAHLLVEEWRGEQPQTSGAFAPTANTIVEDEVAVVGVSVLIGEHQSADALRDAVLYGVSLRSDHGTARAK
ncbi:MAG: polyketide synthase, partial [Myxococcota bacterium]